MKKITLVLSTILFFSSHVFGQSNFLVQAPLNNGSTTQVRAPNGLSTSGYMRACALVLPSELTNIPVGSNISSFGFTLATSTVVTIPVTGNFTVYLENTSDVTYQKGTNFTTAIATMSNVYSSTMTIPIATTASSVLVTLSTPFTYTGGGIYVAYDWYSVGPYSAATNPATYWSESVALSPGCASATGPTTAAAPNTLANTAFRPAFLFEGVNSFTNDVQYVGIQGALGHVPAMLSTPQAIQGVIKNTSNTTLNNVPVTLSVSGANTFVDTQTVSALAAGATTTVNFAPFNPLIPGNNTITVSVPADQNNINNSGTFAQVVGCNEWGLNPSPANYTSQAVGFGTGSGILACSFSNPSTTTLTGLRSAVSTNAPSVGNQAWGVLMNSTGAIIATTNTVVISAAMLGTFQTFTFATPQVLTGSTNYFIGFAQPANATAYFPAGAAATPYISTAIYYNMVITGGTPAPLNVNLGYFGIEAILSPTINMSVNSQTINCGSTATITASGANSYVWNTTATTSAIVVNPVNSTNYTVTGTDALGCSMSQQAALTVIGLPVTVAVSHTSICSGESATLTASGATNYSWTVAGSTVNTTSIVVSPTTSVSYPLVGADLNGCSTATSGVVIVIPSPSISIISSTHVICLGQNVTLNASGAASLVWSTGSQQSSIVLTPTVSDTYSVIGTNTSGCSSTQSVMITVNSFTPGITSSTTICNGDQLTLFSTGGAANSYMWSNGINVFPQITVGPSVTTVYSVTATSATNNCVGVNSTTVTVNPTPTLIATANRTVMCRNETNTVSVSGASTYSWSTGATTQSFVITPTVATVLNYSITGTDANNCGAGTSLVINVSFCTGLSTNSTQDPSVLIYPNPGNGNLVIRSDFGSEGRILIYDVFGKLVRSQSLNGQTTGVDLQNEPAGVYHITIVKENVTVHSSKIVKE